MVPMAIASQPMLSRGRTQISKPPAPVNDTPDTNGNSHQSVTPTVAGAPRSAMCRPSPTPNPAMVSSPNSTTPVRANLVQAGSTAAVDNRAATGSSTTCATLTRIW